MRNVPISGNAITVHAVMAFFFLAFLVGTAIGAELERTTIDYGTTRPCAPTEFGAALAPRDSSERLLASYSESGNLTLRVRILQQGKNFFVDSELTDGVQRAFRPKRSRHSIDAKLAARISAQLARDLASNAFVQERYQLQVDGTWYLYTADGKTCAVAPATSLNPRASDWTRVFSSLYGGTPQGEVKARYLFGKLEQQPPPSLPAMPAWNKP